jgi:spore coat polysaccharide biosynthesis protein SpsF (cytidylyltransferase family)
MESTRLPGKVLLPLCGKTVIQRVVEACRAIRGVDEVVCAIPDLQTSDVLADAVLDLDTKAIRGHATDLLSRYRQAARDTSADVIMRVTADCPMLSPYWCERTLQRLPGHDYADNLREVTAGKDCQVFTWAALDRAFHNATEAYDREHVCPWMQRHLSVAPPMKSWALDTPGDYARLLGEF